MPPNNKELVARLAKEQGISETAVRTVFEALRRGGGTMAQFSHDDFGGLSQWSPGMTMVADMFNECLKAKLNAVAGHLSAYLREHPDGEQHETSAASDRSAGERDVAPWWPAQLGHPSAMGGQDQMRYATFPDKRRLVIDDHGKIDIYDTGEHRISGASQSQSMDSTLGFISQHGVVRVSDLTRVDAT